jgi:hypothetical protein
MMLPAEALRALAARWDNTGVAARRHAISAACQRACARGVRGRVIQRGAHEDQFQEFCFQAYLWRKRTRC